MEIDVIIPLYKPGKELFTLLDKLDLWNQISGEISEH